MPSKYLTLLAGTTGLNTFLDPVRLGEAQPGTAIRPLCGAVNVVIDDSGRPNRVWGYDLLYSGVYRDLFCDGGDVLGVKADVLCLIDQANFAETGLATLTPNLPVAYVQTSLHNRIYWSNGIESGYVQDGKNYTWTRESPDPEDKRSFLTYPPKGTVLAYGNGRLFNAIGRFVFQSERGFPGLYWGRATLTFPTPVIAMAPVADGIWISDNRSIYWLSPYDFTQQTRERKTTYPIILGTAFKISSDMLAYDNLSGIAWLAQTPEGIVALGNGGFFNHRTRGTLETEKAPLPLTAQRGASVVWHNQLISTFEP